MPKIYESPDGGATIYEREFGARHLERRVIKENNELHAKLMEDKMWGEIRRMAKTNPAMRDYADKCIELYHLLKEEK